MRQRAAVRHWECSYAASLAFVRWIGVGEGVPLPRPRLPVVHGTVPPKCARNTLPARSGVLYRPALGELHDRPLPTSSTRAPESLRPVGSRVGGRDPPGRIAGAGSPGCESLARAKIAEC